VPSKEADCETKDTTDIGGSTSDSDRNPFILSLVDLSASLPDDSLLQSSLDRDAPTSQTPRLPVTEPILDSVLDTLILLLGKLSALLLYKLFGAWKPIRGT
jgi:hypothetical protein